MTHAQTVAAVTRPSLRAYRVRCPVCGADVRKPCVGVEPFVHAERAREGKR